MSVFERRYLTLFVFVGITLGFQEAHAGYTALYVFGGLLEEIGNNANLLNRDGRYWPGRMTNGESYVELVAKGLNLGTLSPSSEGGTNYAWGPTSGQLPRDNDKSVRTQVEEYLAGLGDSGVADPDALYLVNGDLREFFAATDDAERVRWATEDAETTLSLVRLLAEKGAGWFLVFQKVEPTQFLGSVILDATQRSAFDVIRLSNETYNNTLGNAVGTATGKGLNVEMVSFRLWVAAAQKARLILNFRSSPTLGENEYFNLFGWGGAGTPTASAHVLLSEIVLEIANRQPAADNAITDLSFHVGDEAWSISLDSPGRFSDEDGDNITYSVSVGDTSVVQAVIDRGRFLILTPGSVGTSRVTLKGSDGAKQAEMSFQVAVILTPGSISIAPGTTDLGEVEVNRGARVNLDIQNAGVGPLQINDVQSDISGVTPVETSFTIAAGETYSLGVTILAGSEGELSGALTILSDDPENGTVTVALTANAVVIPADPRADFNTDGQINLTDFILFVRAFGSDNTTYDLNENSAVDLGDFILFVQAFTRPLL